MLELEKENIEEEFKEKPNHGDLSFYLSDHFLGWPAMTGCLKPTWANLGHLILDC